MNKQIEKLVANFPEIAIQIATLRLGTKTLCADGKYYPPKWTVRADGNYYPPNYTVRADGKYYE